MTPSPPLVPGRWPPGTMYVCCLHIKPFNSTSVHPVSVLILHPREIQILWSQTVRQRKTKQPQLIKVKQVKCWRTWYQNMTKQARPEKYEKKRTKKDKQKADRSSEDCNARSERLQEHTCWRGTDNCCTGETTRRRGRKYRHKAEQKKDKKKTCVLIMYTRVYSVCRGM